MSTTNYSNIRSYLGSAPKLGQGIMIDPSSVVIGNVTLGDNVSIWPLVAIRGDINAIVIGAKTNIQDGSVLHVTHPSVDKPGGFPLIIGDEVTIGHKTMLHGCIIGNRVLIGMGAIILDAVVVEDEVLVGAGSLVPPGKRLESGFLYMGNPVKKIRVLTEDEKKNFSKSANYYVDLKNNYPPTMNL